MTILIKYSAKEATQSNLGALKRVIGKGTYLNQVNGTPISLSPGLPDLEDQFAQLGFVDLRAHDWYGVADIDSYYDTNRKGYIGQITNNSPEDKVVQIKSFAMDFFNRRTICLNSTAFYSGKETAKLNWEPTDSYFKRSLSNKYYKGKEKPNILFRVGRMLDGGRGIPTNVDKYCEIVKQVVSRYSKDYKTTGLPYPITEYEIWNEPDLGLFWSTPDSPENVVKNFYEFYSKVSKAIRSVYPDAKIGPCGTANAYGNKDYVDDLIEYINKNKLPFDFYSYHFYADATGDHKNIFEIQKYVKGVLNKHKYDKVKTYISEWNLTAYGSKENNSKLQSVFAGSFMVSFLINAEQAGIDKAYLYRADGAEFGLFDDRNSDIDPSKKDFATYAAQCMYLYNQFAIKREKPIVLKEDPSKYGITTAGSKNTSGDELVFLLSNHKVDINYVGDGNKNKLPPNAPLLTQHYIDSNIPADKIDLKKWYGSNSAPDINKNNPGDIIEGKYSSNDNSRLTKDSSDHSQSRNGYHIQVSDIPSKFTKFTATFKRVYFGGQLTSLDGETVILKDINVSPGNIIDLIGNVPEKAGDNTVVLITVKLS